MGLLCLNGLCTQECRANKDCAAGLLCVNGKCEQDPCFSDLDCPANSICINGNCSPCGSNVDCKPGYICQNSVCINVNSICGNSQLNDSEQCDDGNSVNGDGCSNLCLIERSSICGNKISEKNEQCDDGNVVNGDGCSVLCTIERQLFASLLNGNCSNGKVDAGEECDDSNTRDIDGCSSVCLLENGRCGDSIVQRALNEQCEPSLHSKTLPYGCTSLCQFDLKDCGNGILNAGEVCDEGNRNSNSVDSSCRLDCRLGRCGDTIVDVGSVRKEQCDDGNTVSGDGCSRECIVEHSAFAQFSSGGKGLYRLPLATLTVQNSDGVVGNTGPAAVLIITSGIAAGIGYVRRRRG